MYEVALASRRANVDKLNYVYDILTKYLSDDNIVITRYSDNNFSYVLLAGDTKHKDKYESIIKQTVISYIINVYKYEYLRESIPCTPSAGLSYEAYIKVLSLFDKSTDEKILNKIIILNQTFFIDSFIEFRMEPLLVHWKELCDLAKDNTTFFLESDTFLDIIRFLVNSMEINCKKIKIMCNDNIYSLYSTQEVGDEVKKVCDSYGKMDLISQVLTLSPMSIDVYISGDRKDEAVGFLSDVYTDRLKIFTN